MLANGIVSGVVGVAEKIRHRPLEWRIGARVAKQVVENPVVKYSVAAANRSLAVLERIPGKTEARFDVLVVVVVHLSPGAGTDDGEVERSSRVGICEQVREVRALLKRNSIELVAHAEV